MRTILLVLLLIGCDSDPNAAIESDLSYLRKYRDTDAGVICYRYGEGLSCLRIP